MTAAALQRLVFRLVPILALGTLAACDTTPAPIGQGAGIEPSENPDPGSGSTDDTCGAASLSPLVGRNIESMDAASLPSNRRVLFTTGAQPTLDNPARLTIVVEPSGRIVRLRCG